VAGGGEGAAAPVATGGVTGGCMGTAAEAWRSHANVSSSWQAAGKGSRERQIRFERLLKMTTWIEKNRNT
jgi:hypothetical protein